MYIDLHYFRQLPEALKEFLGNHSKVKVTQNWDDTHRRTTRRFPTSYDSMRVVPYIDLRSVQMPAHPWYENVEVPADTLLGAIPQ